MKLSKETIYIIDDDPTVTKSIKWLVESVGHSAKTFPSAELFLKSYQHENPSCLILDVKMPGMTGIELQNELNRAGVYIPIIFISAHGDIPMAIKTIKKGAINFLTKPINNQELLETINKAILRFKHIELKEKQSLKYNKLIKTLTPRELEIMKLIIAGKSVKNIAVELKISVNTVGVHHTRILKKMQVANAVELIKLASQTKSIVFKE